MTPPKKQRAGNEAPTGRPLPPGEGRRRLFTLAHLLQHVGKLMHDRMRQRLDALGLAPSQGRVLHILFDRGGLSQRDITRMMRIAAPTLSGILKRMESAGLIERRPDDSDERVTRIHLAARGRRLAAEARAAVEQIDAQLTAGLSKAQQRQAHDLLRRLRDNLGGHGPADEPPSETIVP